MDTYTFDLARIFTGALPIASLMEYLLRAAVMFATAMLLAAVILRRERARRGLQTVTLAALGALTGLATLAVTVPLLHAMAAMAIVAALYGLAARTGVATLGESREPRRVAHNGRLEPDALAMEGVTYEQLFSAMRQAGVSHMGQVKAAYVEPNGQVSVLRCAAGEERPGLPTLPQGEGPGRGLRLRHAVNPGAYACNACGYVMELNIGAPFAPCQSCGGRKWVPALGEHAHSSLDLEEETAPVPEKVQ